MASKTQATSTGESTPDHSRLSLTRERLPMELHQMAFESILKAAADNGLPKGKTLGVDRRIWRPTPRSRASFARTMASTGGNTCGNCTKRRPANAIQTKRSFDKSSKPRKKISNDEWENATDLDSQIGQMKDGGYHEWHSRFRIVLGGRGICLAAGQPFPLKLLTQDD